MRQSIFAGAQAHVDAIVKAGTLAAYSDGETLITQGADDNDIYFILAGEVVIEANGRPGPRRLPGDHVGEMTLIDPATRRSATVRATEATAALRVTEQAFDLAAQKHPALWRGIAQEVARRLRQRLLEVPPRNSQPKLFVGSSVEGLDVAKAIQSNLERSGALVQLWSQGVFSASGTAIDDLEAAVRSSDFAVLVMTADDRFASRDLEGWSPRDNVVLELGMFLGVLGRERTFFVAPRGVDLKIPSDLSGVAPLEFNDGPADTLRARLGPSCSEIEAAVKRLGPN